MLSWDPDQPAAAAAEAMVLAGDRMEHRAANALVVALTAPADGAALGSVLDLLLLLLRQMI